MCEVPRDTAAEQSAKSEIATQSSSTHTLSDEELSSQEASDDQAMEQRLAVIDQLLTGKPDLSKLCANERAASVIAPPATIQEAIAGADLAVWAQIDSVTPTSKGVFADVTVKQAIAGVDVPAKLTVRLGYDIDLTGPPWQLAVAPLPGAPVLVEGDSAILLVKKFDSTWVDTVGGELPIVDGAIDSATRAFTPGAYYADQVDGMTPQQFTSRFAG